MERKRKQRKRRAWGVLAGAAVLAAAGGICALAIREKPAPTESAETSAPSRAADVVWEGKEYSYNDHLSNFLFLGVDSLEKEETAVGQGNAGQADAIYLLSWDRVENTVMVITVPRDTMAQIEAFGPDGKSLGMTKDHISLSYAYGDGGHESCRLAREAVSQLMYGLPIQGYCSISMEGIPLLTECVGSVTVTVPNDSLEGLGEEYREGARITLNADTTEAFVRYRDTGAGQSAMDRMERQQEYIRAFGQAAEQRFSEDKSFAASLYEALEPYMVTNMGNDQFVQIMESVSEGSVKEGWTVPGEAVAGERYDEYHADDQELYQKIIETFYEEAE